MTLCLLKKALAGVKPEHRNIRLREKLHSFYHEMEHIRIAQQDLSYALEDACESPQLPADFWPRPGVKVTDETRNLSMEGFLHDLDAAVKPVENESIDLFPDPALRVYLPQEDNDNNRAQCLAHGKDP